MLKGDFNPPINVTTRPNTTIDVVAAAATENKQIRTYSVFNGGLPPLGTLNGRNERSTDD